MSAHVLLSRTLTALAALLVSSIVVSSLAMAQTPTGTAFTYQGRLTVGGAPANGSYDLSFDLYDDQYGGSTVTYTRYQWAALVQNGVVSVDLDFGADSFTGGGRWLEMGVRPFGETGAFTTLTPRQPVNPVPYALYALNSSTANVTLADGSVTTLKLADAAVTAAKLANGAVGALNLADGAVGTTKLANGAVDATKLAAGAVTATGLADGAVVAGKIGVGAVTSGTLANLAVGTSQLADGAITTQKLGDLYVLAGKLGNGSVTTGKLAAGAVTTNELADGTVATTKLVDGAVTTPKLAAGVITSNELGNASVTTAKLSAGAVTSNELADGAVATAKIAAGAVTTAKLSAGAVTTNELGDGAVATAKLADGAVTAQKVSTSGSVSGQVLTSNGASAVWANTAGSWGLTGNGGTTGSNFIGTTDGQPFDVRVNNSSALRLLPASTPNLVGGYQGNTVTSGVVGGTIGGGGNADSINRVTDDFGTVAGGAGNQAGDEAGLTSWDSYATVGGGQDNTARGMRSTVAGGYGNTADSSGSTVGGGVFNAADMSYSTIAGGDDNYSSAEGSTVGGGGHNVASGNYATVPGGYYNIATGKTSFAAGNHAQAVHDGAFVWADYTGDPLDSGAANQFMARASGGFWFYTSPRSAYNAPGAQLVAGSGSWASMSDRNAKSGISATDAKLILQKLASLPVSTWSYNSQDPSIRHIGPMAQDFAAAFGVGEDDRHISTVDADGVALAAIKGLYETVQEKEAAIASVQQQNAAKITSLQQQNAALEARLAAMEKQLQSGHSGRSPAGSDLPIGLPLAGGIVLSGLALRSWKLPFARRQKTCQIP